MLCMTANFYGNVHTQILLDTKYLQNQRVKYIINIWIWQISYHDHSSRPRW